MGSFADLIAPRFLDGLLGFMLLEFFAIAGWLVLRGQGRFVGPCAAYLLSGAALIAALRLALDDHTARLVVLPLGLSLVGHVAFLFAARRALDLLGPAALRPLESERP